MKRKNSGITLIALVITIIIMLILAGVTISIVGGSDGLLAKAEKAVSETEKAAMQEDAELAIATIKMEYYEDYATNKNMTAKEFIVAKLAEPYETARGATLVADAEGNITYTLDEVATSLTIDENGKVTFGESSSGEAGSGGSGEGGSGETTPTIPEVLQVGDTVTYSPSGTYNWEEEYYASTVDYYDVALATGDEVASTNQDMSITTWKVFSIDESTGEVELVPSAATANKVTLQGAQGYNNAVKLLNDACSDLYGNSSKGITARSININDIENIINSGETNFVDYYKTTYPPDDYGLNENYQVTSAYTTDKNYPTIYEQEDLSTIAYDNVSCGAEEVKISLGEGFGRSEQTSLIGRTAKGAVSEFESSNGYITSAFSIRPYGTWYDLMGSDFSNLLGEEYTSMLFPSGDSTSYWVASRRVGAHSNYCDFGIACFSGDGIYGVRLFSSDFSGNWSTKSLFPVVSLNASFVSGNDTDGWKVE